ncbi:phosphate ABC transporter substrate-binding protein [Lacticaseibacillus porcinae]|uniref:phosphate ABC transporter substrate-binding protein n=1 Tax=Lacticaseibacillus porcinae TaxID=1123687 RepID=UPI000F772402|nr:phosphate ABC transporter substrate-binding protein [Lacticaseibacillus porcinae]
MKKLTWLLCSLLVLGLTGCGIHQATAKNDPTITIAGSTAMQPLLKAAANAQKNTITIKGGGSAAGLNAVATDKVTIGAADMFAENSNTPAVKLVDHQIAVVGIAPIIDPDAGVSNLTTDQLKAVFAGKLTNWQQLGGKAMPIKVFVREAGSGTRTAFEALALRGVQGVQGHVLNSSQAMVKQVKNTPGAIGYVAFSALQAGVRPLLLNGVNPTDANVTTNRWEIWAYEHLYTNGAPSAPVAKFIHQVQTDDAQIKQLGYIPTSAMQVARTHDGQIEDTY